MARALSGNGRRAWNNVVEGEDVTGAVPAALPHPPCNSMSDFPDYYAILGVPRTATTEEIRAAYKRESLRYVDTPLLPSPWYGV